MGNTAQQWRPVGRPWGWLIAACFACWSAARAHAQAPGAVAEAPSEVATSPAWKLTWSAWAQGDAVAYAAESQDELDPNTGTPLNEERAYIRRARLRADFERGRWQAMAELDGNTVDEPTLRLLAASVGTKWAWPAATLDLRAGLRKIPFGAELVQDERTRIFPELSTAARALFPGNYDMGVHALATWHNISVVVAATNGAPVADAQWQGRDPSASHDYLARLAYKGQPLAALALEIGVSGLVGKGLSPGRAPSNDDLVWVDANEDGLVQTTELQVIAGDPGLPSSAFDRNALGVDASATWRVGTARGLVGRAFAELIIATNLDRGLLYADPVAASRDLRELGWMVGVEQAFPHAIFGGIRYDRYQPDRDALDVQGEAVVRADPRWGALEVVGGISVHGVRIQASYAFAQNPLGRNDAGAPTTRKADVLLLRATWGLP